MKYLPNGPSAIPLDCHSLVTLFKHNTGRVDGHLIGKLLSNNPAWSPLITRLDRQIFGGKMIYKGGVRISRLGSALDLDGGERVEEK